MELNAGVYVVAIATTPYTILSAEETRKIEVKKTTTNGMNPITLAEIEIGRIKIADAFREPMKDIVTGQDNKATGGRIEQELKEERRIDGKWRIQFLTSPTSRRHMQTKIIPQFIASTGGWNQRGPGTRVYEITEPMSAYETREASWARGIEHVIDRKAGTIAGNEWNNIAEEQKSTRGFMKDTLGRMEDVKMLRPLTSHFVAKRYQDVVTAIEQSEGQIRELGKSRGLGDAIRTVYEWATQTLIPMYTYDQLTLSRAYYVITITKDHYEIIQTPTERLYFSSTLETGKHVKRNDKKTLKKRKIPKTIDTRKSINPLTNKKDPPELLG